MSSWTRLGFYACALSALCAAAPPDPSSGPVFPARATGAEGTTMAIQAAGEAERTFQTEKERQRAKDEQERLVREAEQKRVAEAARLERERTAREQQAAADAERAITDAAKAAANDAASAAAAEKVRATQARIASGASAGELFALADELKSSGDEAGSRAALRGIIARFPENKLADVAMTMLTGMTAPAAAGVPVAAPVRVPVAVPPVAPGVPAAPAVQAATAPPAAVAQTPRNNACLATLAQFNAARPQGNSGAGTLVERQVFYGRYFDRMLVDVPACRSDEAIAQRVRADIQANLAACLQTPGANCTTGIPDADVRVVDAAYDRIVAAALRLEVRQ